MLCRSVHLIISYLIAMFVPHGKPLVSSQMFTCAVVVNCMFVQTLTDS